MVTVWIIAVIIYSLLWAAVCFEVSKNKGYEYEAGKWFAIGFLLGIFGFLIVISKPTNTSNNSFSNQNVGEVINGYQRNSNNIQSAADEIVKLKKLYDQGIITEEEFKAKKDQLLKLI